MTSIKKLVYPFIEALSRAVSRFVSTVTPIGAALCSFGASPRHEDEESLPDGDRPLQAAARAVGVTILLLFASAGPWSGYAAQGWVIQPLVLPGDVIGDKTIVNVIPLIDLDEDGTATFVADYTDASHPNPSEPGRGIFTQERTVVVVGDLIQGESVATTIAAIDIDARLRMRPSISNGTVVYVANIPPNATVFGVFKEQEWAVEPGEQLDPEGDTASRPFCCAASINSSGTVVFNSGAFGTPVGSTRGIYTSPGGVVVRRLGTYDGIDLQDVDNTAISDNGTVVSHVNIFDPFKNDGFNMTSMILSKWHLSD